MIKMNAERVPGDFEGYLKKTPKITDCKKIITADTAIMEDGRPVIIYKKLPKDTVDELRHLIRTAKYTKSARSNGIPTQSAIFGHLPRITYRNNYCRVTADTRTQKELAVKVLAFSQIIDQVYRDLLPEQHDINLEIVRENVHGDYVIKDTPFTTINFNVNHAIKYHRDSGNFRGVYSNVLIVKENMEGGELICPELGIGFDQADGALILFDGQKIIHGVTPLVATGEPAYRSSCVFYSLATMKNCYPYKEELARIKKVRDEIESRWRTEPENIGGYKKALKNGKI